MAGSSIHSNEEHPSSASGGARIVWAGELLAWRTRVPTRGAARHAPSRQSGSEAPHRVASETGDGRDGHPLSSRLRRR